MIFHYVNKHGKLRKTIAAIREVSGEHTGDNLAEVVMKVIKEWGIQEKLGYFIMDNAPNNDTMIRKIAMGT